MARATAPLRSNPESMSAMSQVPEAVARHLATAQMNAA